MDVGRSIYTAQHAAVVRYYMGSSYGNSVTFSSYDNTKCVPKCDYKYTPLQLNVHPVDLSWSSALQDTGFVTSERDGPNIFHESYSSKLQIRSTSWILCYARLDLS